MGHTLASHRHAIAFALLLVCFAAQPSGANDDVRSQMQSLDEQVQEIKSDVLGIAAELGRLEERLLYPSNTQIAVFVSLAEDDGFELDSVQIEIDGKLVARHIYTLKELEALRKGGVQRIYTGNVPTGEHRVDVSVSGSRAGGDEITGAQSFHFIKEVEPKPVGITIVGRQAGSIGIRLEDG